MKKNVIAFIILTLLPVLLFTQDGAQQEDLMYDHYDRGYDEIYSNKDSAYHYLGKAAKIASEISDYNTELDILSYLVIASDNHYDIKNYNLFLDQTKALLEQDSITSKVENLKVYQNLYLENKANYYYKTNELVKAKSIYLDLRSQYIDMPFDSLTTSESQSLFSVNSFLATIYKHLGRFELSEQFYLKNRSLVEGNDSLADYSDAYINNLDHLIAQLYGQMGKYERANKLQVKVLNYYKIKYFEDKKYKNNLVSAFQKITITLIEQDSLESALSYLNESQEYLLSEDPFYKEALLLYGIIYSKQNLNQKSLVSYQNALKSFQQYHQNIPHQDIAKVYVKIAELQLKQQNYQDGVETIQKAFNVAGSNIQITNFNQNPNANDVFSKTQLLHLLDVKLQFLQGNLAETSDPAYQQAILQTSRDILATFDLLKSEFDSKLDKQYLAERAYPIFHRLLETTHKAYEKNPSSETLQLALNIAEKNKDFVLLEALRNAQATQYGDVPSAILEKEAQLRAEITNVEKQLFDANETGSDFSETLFNLKQEYYGFLEKLKTKYPKYHELKYQNRTLDLVTVREKVLDDNGTLISYTIANDQLYVIVVNDSKQDFIKLPFNDADRENIKEFYRLLSTPTINEIEGKITDIAQRLFEKILQKPLADFDAENLTIIPDGELHYLPFDLLQVNGRYLLETKNVSYGNSVTSLVELKEKKHAENNKMLALAPIFSGAVATNMDRQFGKLLYNDDEVQKIGTFYDSEALFEEEATLANFIAKASQFNIFHLATHASANDEYPDYSYLAFTKTKDSTENNFLYIKDLYNSTINADLVTLSACQTGIGKLQKGQGMLSLSKGFYYAGAKSIVNTLWKINDKSTVNLMEFFYENLSNGQSKKEALRNAKLSYLKTTDDDLLKHPYYWASFMVSGDASPISKNNNRLYLGLAGLSLALVFFLIFKMKRKP